MVAVKGSVGVACILPLVGSSTSPTRKHGDILVIKINSAAF